VADQDVMIVNVAPYQGEYPLDIENQPFSTVEWRWIKQISGYLPLTMDKGWAGGDPDLFLSFAVIAMRRANRIEKADVLRVASEIEEAPADGAAITFRGSTSDEDEEDDADPTPASLPDAGPSPSGGDSSESTEPTPESENPKVTGIRDWATGSDSGQETLAS